MRHAFFAVKVALVSMSLSSPATSAETPAGVVDLTPEQQQQLNQLWDMTEIRKVPLTPEKGATRKAPLVVPGAADWMNQGDSWVAKKDSKAHRASTKKAANDEQILIEEYYYSSESTPQGPNRIYCAIARPEKTQGKAPVLLVFHGGGGHGTGALALAIARRHPGMAALAMDYNGQFMKGESKVTQWKNVDKERKLKLVPNLRNYPMYHYVTAARRAIDFLESQPWADANRIGAVGISYGGWVALILAGVDDRVRVVTNGVSAGGMAGTAGRGAQQLRWKPKEQHAIWLAAYDPIAYAKSTHAAVFLNLASNDLYFWLSGASRNLAALVGEKGWLVRPNCNHGTGGPEIPDAVLAAWVRHTLRGGPAVPKVTDFQVSPDGAVYRWKVSGPNPVAKTVLNWSLGKVVSPGRYWVELPAEQSGDEWVARVPKPLSDMASEAYVNAMDSEELAVSSVVLSHDETDPRTQAGPQWAGDALWDVSRGAAAWRTPGAGAPKAEFDIVAPNGIKMGPAKGSKQFSLLTNSVVLASGVAAQHPGLRLRINGGGHSGKLKISLLRDTMSMDEVAYTTEIHYEAGTSTHVLPWSQFKSKTAGAPSKPWPFDGLAFEGQRSDGSSLIIESVGFTD